MTAENISASAPGRIELLGNHTDYNEGLVLGAAIDRQVTVAGTLRCDGLIELASDSFAGRVSIPLAELQPQPDRSWANYALGVAHELLQRGLALGGFNAGISTNLPAGYGLSSSAALEVATAYFLLRAHHLELPPLEIARACQAAENNFVGVQSGLLDQVTSIFGRAEHAVFFDARSHATQTFPFPSGLALVIAESAGRRELSKGVYNERRRECQEAALALGLPSLREATLSMLDQRRDIDAVLWRRARHIAEENDRVQRGVELLSRGDGAGFGALLYQSHESSKVNFENSTPQLNALVEAARGISGVLGARLTGAGFGGATITLCPNGMAPEVARALGRIAGGESKVFVCRIADGALIANQPAASR